MEGRFGWDVTRGPDISVETVIFQGNTYHMEHYRKKRLEQAIACNVNMRGKQSPVVSVFRVDRGHPDGVELHCVTGRGLLFVLNEGKYSRGEDSLVTVLFPRVPQVRRLYRAVGRDMPGDLVKQCRRWEHMGTNNW